MKAIIDKMRADFIVVGEDRVQSGQWTEADYAEVGAAIKAAIASDEPTQVFMWARWLADLAAWVTAFRMICVPINRSIEAHIQVRRLETATAAATASVPKGAAR